MNSRLTKRVVPFVAMTAIGAVAYTTSARAAEPLAIVMQGSADDEYNRGVDAQNKGDNATAIAAYSNAIKKRATFTDAYYNRGIAYEDTGDFDKALADFNAYLQRKPQVADAYLERAKVYGKKNMYDQAIADFNKYSELKPNKKDHLFARGGVYFGKGDFDKAIADYTAFMASVPATDSNYQYAYLNRANSYLQKGDAAKAVPDFTAFLAKAKPAETADALVGRGDAYTKSEQYAKAATDYEAYLALPGKANDGPVQNALLVAYDKSNQPQKAVLLTQRMGASGDPTAILNSAIVQGKAGNNAGAVTAYTKYLGLPGKSKDKAALSGRAAANISLKDYPAAITDYTAVLSVDAKDSTALFNRAVAYSNTKQYDKAAADFETYLSGKPNDEAGLQGLALAYVNEPTPEWQKVAGAYSRYLAANPKDAKAASQAHYNRGVAYFNLKDYQKAIADLEPYSTANPTDANAKDLLGKAYVNVPGGGDKAIAALTAAIAAKPNDPDNYYNRGVLYSNANQLDKAAADFEMSATKDTKVDGKATSYYNAAVAYLRMPTPNYDKVITAATGALTAKPGYAEALLARADARLAKKEYAPAAADYKAYLATPTAADPKNKQFADDAATNMGAAYINGKDYAGAVAAYTTVLAKNPDNVAAMNLRAQANLQLKAYPAAIADFTSYIGKKGDDATAYYNRGYAYAQTKDDEKAAADYEKSFSLKAAFDPANSAATIYSRLGQAESKKDSPDANKAAGYFDKAIALYDKAATAGGGVKNTAAAYYNQGLAYEYKAKVLDKDDELKGAIAAYTKYLSTDPAATDKAEVSSHVKQLQEKVSGGE